MPLSWEERALVLVRIRILVVARHYLYRAAPELLPGAFLVTGTREGRKEKYLVLVHVRAQPLDIRLHDVGRPVVLVSLLQGVSSWRGVCAPSTTFPSPSALFRLLPCLFTVRPQRRCIESLLDPVVGDYLQREKPDRERVTSNDNDDDDDAAVSAVNLKDRGSRPRPTRGTAIAGARRSRRMRNVGAQTTRLRGFAHRQQEARV